MQPKHSAFFIVVADKSCKACSEDSRFAHFGANGTWIPGTLYCGTFQAILKKHLWIFGWSSYHLLSYSHATPKQLRLIPQDLFSGFTSHVLRKSLHRIDHQISMKLPILTTWNRQLLFCSAAAWGFVSYSLRAFQHIHTGASRQWPMSYGVVSFIETLWVWRSFVELFYKH